MDSLTVGSADIGRGDAAQLPAAFRPVAVPHRQVRRELAQLSFSHRMLALAEDAACPLLESLRLLCTVGANLDRFFELRMAHLEAACERAAMEVGRRPDTGGAFDTVMRAARELTAAQYQLLNARLLPALQQHGIRFLRRTDFSPRQSEWVRRYFFRQIRPVLTPIGLDPAHPFPRVLSRSLNFAVEVRGKDAFGRNAAIAIVQAPRVLPRVIRVPNDIAETEYGFVFLSSVLHAQMDELFGGMEVAGCHQFRVTRNRKPLSRDDAAFHSGRSSGMDSARNGLGKAVRLEVANNCSPRIAAFLLDQFDLHERDLYRVDGPVNLVRLMSVPDCIDRPDLKFPGSADPADPHDSSESAAVSG